MELREKGVSDDRCLAKPTVKFSDILRQPYTTYVSYSSSSSSAGWICKSQPLQLRLLCYTASCCCCYSPSCPSLTLGSFIM